MFVKQDLVGSTVFKIYDDDDMSYIDDNCIRKSHEKNNFRGNRMVKVEYIIIGTIYHIRSLGANECTPHSHPYNIGLIQLDYLMFF